MRRIYPEFGGKWWQIPESVTESLIHRIALKKKVTLKLPIGGTEE